MLSNWKRNENMGGMQSVNLGTEKPSHRGSRGTIEFCLTVATIFLCFAVEGCSKTPQTSSTPAAETTARAPHKTLMLNIEFANAGAAKMSPVPLKSAMEGVAAVENGPFPVPGTPLVKLAVSVPPQASADPVLQKIREVAEVKKVTVVPGKP